MRVYPPKKQTTTSHHESLTMVQKGRILEARDLGKSHSEIGAQLHIPRTTVTSFLQRFDSCGSEENLPHSGCPCKTSAALDQYIIRTSLEHTDITNDALRDITDLGVSTSTIRRRLREDRIRKWRAVKRALLTDEHPKKRLEWATQHQSLTREDWKKIFWSDECAVKKDSDNQTMWVFRHSNKREKYLPKNIRGRAQGGRISQMIWGCFAGDKLGPIVFIDGDVNTDSYINVLRDHLFPFVDLLIANGLTDAIFQQDNARPHVSKRTLAFLNTSMLEHGFKLMNWPPNSPDMNPIENLWSHLEHHLHRRFPDTKYLHGGGPAVKHVLIERLHTVWWEIGEEVLNRLIDSMPHRVQALLAAGGWYTDH